MATIFERLLKAEHDAMNSLAGIAQGKVDADDIAAALVELGNLLAEQDDAIVELAEIIEED